MMKKNVQAIIQTHNGECTRVTYLVSSTATTRFKSS